MGKWFKQFESIIWAISLGAATLAYCYQSFATIKYVDEKHQSVMEVLRDIQTSVHQVQDQTFELADRGRHK